MRSILPILARSLLTLALLTCFAAGWTSACDAQQARWPAASSLPKAAPPPAPPPAVLERAPSANTFAVPEKSRVSAKVCGANRTCVVCVAACDGTPPIVVQSLKPLPTGAVAVASAENDSDGVADNAPRYARPEWAGITCGSEGGCRVAGVLAPGRASEHNVNITVFQTEIGPRNRYIDR